MPGGPAIACIHITPVHGDASPVHDAVRELGAERVILVPDGDVDEVAEVLAPLGVDTETRAVEGPMLLGRLKLVQAIARDHRDRREDELAILNALQALDGEAGLHQVADRAGLDASTVTYKVRGGDDAEGLEPLDLVEDGKGEDGVVLRLTSMGTLLGDTLRL